MAVQVYSAYDSASLASQLQKVAEEDVWRCQFTVKQAQARFDAGRFPGLTLILANTDRQTAKESLFGRKIEAMQVTAQAQPRRWAWTIEPPVTLLYVRS